MSNEFKDAGLTRGDVEKRIVYCRAGAADTTAADSYRAMWAAEATILAAALAEWDAPVKLRGAVTMGSGTKLVFAPAELKPAGIGDVQAEPYTDATRLEAVKAAGLKLNEGSLYLYSRDGKYAEYPTVNVRDGCYYPADASMGRFGPVPSLAAFRAKCAEIAAGGKPVEATPVANDTDPNCPVWKARRYTSEHAEGEYKAAFIKGKWREPLAAKNCGYWCYPRYASGDGTLRMANGSFAANTDGYTQIVPMSLVGEPAAPVEAAPATDKERYDAMVAFGLKHTGTGVFTAKGEATNNLDSWAATDGWIFARGDAEAKRYRDLPSFTAALDKVFGPAPAPTPADPLWVGLRADRDAALARAENAEALLANVEKSCEAVRGVCGEVVKVFDDAAKQREKLQAALDAAEKRASDAEAISKAAVMGLHAKRGKPTRKPAERGAKKGAK